MGFHLQLSSMQDSSTLLLGVLSRECVGVRLSVFKASALYKDSFFSCHSTHTALAIGSSEIPATSLSTSSLFQTRGICSEGSLHLLWVCLMHHALWIACPLHSKAQGTLSHPLRMSLSPFPHTEGTVSSLRRWKTVLTYHKFFLPLILNLNVKSLFSLPSAAAMFPKAVVCKGNGPSRKRVIENIKKVNFRNIIENSNSNSSSSLLSFYNAPGTIINN